MPFRTNNTLLRKEIPFVLTYAFIAEYRASDLITFALNIPRTNFTAGCQYLHACMPREIETLSTLPSALHCDIKADDMSFADPWQKVDSLFILSTSKWGFLLSGRCWGMEKPKLPKSCAPALRTSQHSPSTKFELHWRVSGYNLLETDSRTWGKYSHILIYAAASTTRTLRTIFRKMSMNLFALMLMGGRSNRRRSRLSRQQEIMLRFRTASTTIDRTI